MRCAREADCGFPNERMRLRAQFCGRTRGGQDIRDQNPAAPQDCSAHRVVLGGTRIPQLLILRMVKRRRLYCTFGYHQGSYLIRHCVTPSGWSFITAIVRSVSSSPLPDPPSKYTHQPSSVHPGSAYPLSCSIISYVQRFCLLSIHTSQIQVH